MTSNYELICKENQERYGTDIGRIGPMLLADRYDDRTHFIFELLQNAEDSLGRRTDWKGRRGVSFDLTEGSLSLSHFGKPFDEPDVRGICGIAESTKKENSIGRFGIGFKSVYIFTDRPEIHSGGEDFAIENYVQPKATARRNRDADETLIVLPLKSGDVSAYVEIADGFKRLGASALLFLRHIDEICWNVAGSASGLYLRSPPEPLGPNVERITVIGQESGQQEVDQNWLVFHREVAADDQEKVGRVEVAFSIIPVKDAPGRWAVQPVTASPLVVFFPTVVSTNLGFLLQGPYITTPSRDNVPRSAPWNQHLVKETAALLVDSIRWLRDEGIFETSTLRCLPLDREKFADGSMFAPLFDVVRNAIANEALLPKFDGGYVCASNAKLARTQDLRELFAPSQMAAIFGDDISAWLSGEITLNRAPEVRRYVMEELEVAEVTPANILPRLSKEFLEAQTDDWVLRLYRFLSGQEAALRRQLDAVPLIRLNDGSHVVAKESGKPKAFLPSGTATDFPTMRKEVCATDEVRSFLISLGITEPDPVDDVIWNVLPKYQQNKVSINPQAYAADIARIRDAFNTDSNTQRTKLVSALHISYFLMVFDAGNGSKYRAKPDNVFLPTERLKQLYAGVPGIFIVDDSYTCFRGGDLREFLEPCGAYRCPRPVEAPRALTLDEQRELRKQAGHEQTSNYKDRIEDWTLQGFDDLIKILPTLEREERVKRARLLWESLGDLEERRGRGVFTGTYTWSHHGNYKAEFPSAFVRRLNSASWVPDANGNLQPPNLVVFESLGWKPNPFPLSMIAFKPPLIDQLAREAGIDPALLDLLKKHGITSEADLKSRLGITDQSPEPEQTPPASANVYEDAMDLYGDLPDYSPGDRNPEDGDDNQTARGQGRGNGGSGGGGASHGGGNRGGSGTTGASGVPGNSNGNGGNTSGKRTPGHAGNRPFVSYVGTHLDGDNGPDPDGLDQAARMKIEESAVQQIIKAEPVLNRTPAGNPGYDLYEKNASDEPFRWVEVKAMTGALTDRPVGLSHTQFEFARQHGAAYWIYVVEHALDPEKARILRINDPFANARTFTFDHGWAQIAKTEAV